MSQPESPWLDKEPWGLAPWLVARLDATAREVAAEWGLELGPRIEAGSYSFVAPAGDAILKVVPAEDDMVATQAEALRLWNGDGAVRLLRHDPDRHAMLLERARPGNDASTVDPRLAIGVAVTVAMHIWRPVERHGIFPWVGDRVPRWLDDAGDHELVRRARERFRGLALPKGDVLLHGDFHHHNLIRRGDEWRSIPSRSAASASSTCRRSFGIRSAVVCPRARASSGPSPRSPRSVSTPSGCAPGA